MGLPVSIERRSKAAASEKGAVLLEAAIALLFLLTVCSGILEYASLFAQSVDLSGAVRSAARTGALTTSDGVSNDAKILSSALQKAGSKRTNIDRIVVYQADSPASKPDPSCVNGATSTVHKCNVYSGSELGNTNVATKGGWPVTNRVAGSDYIGVYIHATRKTFFNLVPSPTSYSDTFTLKIAPIPEGISSTNWTPPVSGKAPTFNEDWVCWDSARGCFHEGNGPGDPGLAGGGTGSG